MIYMKWLWCSPFALASAFSAEAWWWWCRTVSFRWFGWITWLKDELPTSFRAIVVISDLPTQFESPIVPTEVDWDCWSCCCDGGAAGRDGGGGGGGGGIAGIAEGWWKHREVRHFCSLENTKQSMNWNSKKKSLNLKIWLKEFFD